MTDHPALLNSKRRHEKRTYTPLIVDEPGRDGGTDALGLAARVRGLMLSSGELAQLREHLHAPGQLSALNAISDLTTAVSGSAVLAAASNLLSASLDDLRSVSDALGQVRSAAADHLTSALHDLDKSHAAETRYSGVPGPRPADPAQTSTPAPHSSGHGLGALFGDSLEKLTSRAPADAVPESARTIELFVPAGVSTAPRVADLAMAAAGASRKATPVRMLQIALGPGLSERAPSVLAWGLEKRPEQLRPLLDIAEPYMPDAADPAAGITAALSNLTRLHLLTKLFNQSLERVPITWNHVIEKDSLKIKELEHVLIEKVEQLFRDML